MIFWNRDAIYDVILRRLKVANYKEAILSLSIYEGWNFNSGNYLFTTDTK
jgi:hypothetical protein